MSERPRAFDDAAGDGPLPAADRPDPATLVFQTMVEVSIIQQLAQAQLERVLPDGLLSPHFAVLNHCVRLDRQDSPAQLARAMQVTKGAMTNTLQRLQARGLVVLSPDPDDGRVKRVAVTASGRALHNRAAEAMAPELRHLAQQLGPDAFAQAMPFLRRLRAALDQMRE